MAGIEAVEVYWDASQSLEPALMGTLHRQPSGKGEVLSFKYAGAWLNKSDAFSSDPNLALRLPLRQQRKLSDLRGRKQSLPMSIHISSSPIRLARTRLR